MVSLLKGFHLIAMVSWFAGLFYLGRLLIYIVQAHSREGAEMVVDQLRLMAKRLAMIITIPAMVLTFGAGIWLMVITEAYRQGWMHTKLLLVVLLAVYTVWAVRLALGRLDRLTRKSPKSLRFANEVPTLFLIVIVFLAVARQLVPALVLSAWTLLFFLLVGCVGMLVARRIRSASDTSSLG